MARILKWTSIVTGSLIGLFILLAILVNVFGGSSDGQANDPAPRATSAGTPVASSPTPTRMPTATLRPTPTPIIVTANALERQHEANEVRWESQYADKYALITGSISSITEASNQYDVKLDTDNLWVNIVCKVRRSSKSSVLELAKGETVTVYGLVTNDGIIDIVVRNCTVRTQQPVQDSGQEQSHIATQVPVSTPQRTDTPELTSTPDPFTQYQGTAKKAAILTVYVGTPTGSGSGFLYRLDNSEEFVVLTNSHVVQDHSSVEVCWALTQECAYALVKDRGSASFDVAVLEVSQNLKHGETFRWFSNWFGSNIAESKERWNKGDVVYASGYPGGHKIQETDIISDPMVTEGIIASDKLASYRGEARFIEHGANIEPGSSGGPLMNNAANIVGINTGTNLLTEQLELAIPMSGVIEWLETGEEPILTQKLR